MNSALRHAFRGELGAAAGHYAAGEFAQAFYHLDIAHVLGQQYVVPHVLTHYWMLRIGVKRRSLAQVWGQGIRMVLGALGSAVGVVPLGNTGGTDISMFKHLPLDPAIEKLMQ